MMVARFDKVKNLELAFRLYEYFNGNFVLDIYGNGISPRNSYLKNMLDEHIPKASLSNLGLKGQVTNLNSKFIDYDYILLTSRQEGLPISIIEASQNGLLPISSDVGDTKKASSGYGFFFKDNSFSDLIDKFNKAKNICERDNYDLEETEYSKLTKSIFEKSNKEWGFNEFIEKFLND